MLINIAGLQSVPTELYEAARIDGAGAWKMFRRITIPLMSPILLYNLVISLITDVPVLHPGLHDDQRPRRPEQRDAVHQPRPVPRRRSSSTGWATSAAIAWLLFVIVLVLTVGLFAFAREARLLRRG